MKKRIKPDLGDGIGAWVDPNYIPGLLRARLRRIMTAQGFTDADAEAFLKETGELVQMTVDSQWLIGPGKQREELMKIAGNADRLLQSLTLATQQTRDSLQIQSELVKHLEDAQTGVPKSVVTSITSAGGVDHTLQGVAWDFIEALSLIAERAAAQLDPSRQGRPDLANAQQLTRLVVDAFYHRFGKLPPSDPGAWFAEIMSAIGQHFDISCGPRITRGAVKAKEEDLTLMGKESGST